MTKEYRAKVFKSGNSVAMRLPKALGIVEGTEMLVREDKGRFAFEPAPTRPKKVDLTGIWGACPDLKPLTLDERSFEPLPRIWDDPDWQGWAESEPS